MFLFFFFREERLKQGPRENHGEKICRDYALHVVSEESPLNRKTSSSTPTTPGYFFEGTECMACQGPEALSPCCRSSTSKHLAGGAHAKNGLQKLKARATMACVHSPGSCAKLVNLIQVLWFLHNALARSVRSTLKLKRELISLELPANDSKKTKEHIL